MHPYKMVIYRIFISTNYDICKALNPSLIREEDLKAFKNEMTLIIRKTAMK